MRGGSLEKQTRDSKVVIYLCAFLIPFLMMQVFWALCRVYPFGDRSILTGDMNIEFVNFYAYFINTLKTGNDWSYMFTKTLGGDFPGLAAFQLHDPLLFLLLLFPGESIVTGIELIFSLQVSIAGLSASVLLNNRYKRSPMSLLFSTGYAFSAFFFGYLVLTIYFGALAILPLVLYFYLKVIETGRGAGAFILTAALYIYINYHMGFMLCIFLLILYVSRLITDRSYIRRLPKIAWSAVTILLIDGFFLVRTGLSLLGEKTTEGADYGFYRRFPMNQMFAGMFSGCARNDLRPLIYCGIIPFFFAVMYFVIPRIAIKEKIANLFLIAVLAVSMWINTFDAVWHGFNNPEGFYWRYAYYISIITVVTGYKGLLAFMEEPAEGGGRIRYLGITTGILAVYMIWLTIVRNPYLDLTRLAINGALIAVIASVLFIMTKRTAGTAGFVILMILAVCEMLYSSKTSYLCLNIEGDSLPAIAEFRDDYRNINDVISYIKSQDDGFYRIEKDFDRGINDPSLFDYIGLSHDSSCEKDRILDWLVNFGFCKTVYYTYYNGGSTSFVDDLFGVRYYVSIFDETQKPYERMPYEGKYYAFRNDNALPMAFIAPPGLKDTDLAKGNTFEKQNRVASCWDDRDIFIRADAETVLEGAVEDGIGHYVRTDDEGYVVYNIRITSEMPLYFYFYAPSRQNGAVFVNGEPYDAYFTVNHWNTLCAGRYTAGDEVEIRMQIVDEELTIDEACFYYEDADAINEWGMTADELNGSIGDVTKITSSHLTFEVDSDKTSTVVMTIPYEESWRILCDGKRIEGMPALDMLMSFEVPEGEHVIDMKYTPEGTWPGIILSLIGIVMFFAKGKVFDALKIVEKVENGKNG